MQSPASAKLTKRSRETRSHSQWKLWSGNHHRFDHHCQHDQQTLCSCRDRVRAHRISCMRCPMFLGVESGAWIGALGSSILSLDLARILLSLICLPSISANQSQFHDHISKIPNRRPDSMCLTVNGQEICMTEYPVLFDTFGGHCARDGSPHGKRFCHFPHDDCRRSSSNYNSWENMTWKEG